MTIACLGWGSLVWDPHDLPVRSPWFADGPLLPIEFTRQSADGRITLVLTPKAPLIRSLWALVSTDDVRAARTRLGEREGVPSEKTDNRISVWNGTQEEEPNRKRIAQWAQEKNLQAVLWTGLPPKMKGVKGVPSSEHVIGYLRNLAREHEKFRHAERYVRMAPMQIDTEYRRAIEAEFGWTCLSEI